MVSAHRKDIPPSGRQVTPQGAGQLLFNAADSIQKCNREGTGGGRVSARPQFKSIMKILVACEFSGIVRDAFIAKGHQAVSCDLLPSERTGPHIQGDVLTTLKKGWDMLIGHPPCTHLAVSGARWFKHKMQEQADAVAFFMSLAMSGISKVCLENPVSVMSTKWRKPDQIIQPWQFGHPETKATCLWLQNLPKLKPTNVVEGREARIHKMPPSPDRWKNRSRTFQGIAGAMADQWS